MFCIDINTADLQIKRHVRSMVEEEKGKLAHLQKYLINLITEYGCHVYEHFSYKQANYSLIHVILYKMQ